MGVNGSKMPRALTEEGRLAGAKFDDVELHVISLTYKDLAGLSKGDKGGESIDKATFLQNFPVPGLVGDRLFHALDSNKSGRISFDDFLVGLAVCCRGSLEEKMRFLFGVYDMNEDGLIGRDELLLMLNQMPRTLLNIGIDANGKAVTNSLNLAAETKAEAKAQGGDVTPRSTRGGGGDFFGGDGGRERAPPPPPSAARGTRGRNRSGESGSNAATEAGERRLRSTFTNESIADQAIKDFGDGPEKPLTFEQFRRWAQSTPAVQALLQGAFPSEAHFSLATSPTARRSTCESLSTLDTPRQPVSARHFGTPNATRESRSAATAISAWSAWSASAASARPPSMTASLRGTPLRQRLSSLGVEAQAEAAASSAAGGGGRGGGDGVGAGENGGDVPAPLPPPLQIGSRTPSRTPSRSLSRNTSYDNLLRSPLVGQGVWQAARSPMPRGGGGGVGEPGRLSSGASGMGAVAAAAKTPWTWGKVVEEPVESSAAGGAHGSGDDDKSEEGRGVSHSSAKGGIRKERERERIPPPPLPSQPWAGRNGRVLPPPSSSPRLPAARRGLSGGSATSLPFDPPSSGSSTSGAPPRSSQRSIASVGSFSFTSEDGSGGGMGGGGADDALAAAGSKRQPSTPRASSVASSLASATSNNGDARPPPRMPSGTPNLGGGGGEADKANSHLTGEMTRKARKLAMMAAAAETAVGQFGGDGLPPDTQDLLALANAATASEKPPARPPRRGTLMRYLSHDGMSSSAADGRVQSTGSAGRKVLSRMTSLQDEASAGAGSGQANGGINSGGGGDGVRSSRRRKMFRRAISLSNADDKERAHLSGGGDSSGMLNSGKKDPSSIGIPPQDETAGETSASLQNSTAAAGSVAMAAPSPRLRASINMGVFNSSGYFPGDDSVARAGLLKRRGGQAAGGAFGDDNGISQGSKKISSYRRSNSSTAAAPRGAPMPSKLVLPSADVSLGLPLSSISPLLKADRGEFPLVNVSANGEQETAQAAMSLAAMQAAAPAGVEAVVRDCFYNSHGMVALDGYLWKPGSIRLLRRWMMLVDNTLYYFIRPGDRKPRGVISLPGCIAEAVSSEDQDQGGDGGGEGEGEGEGDSANAKKGKECRKTRVPSGYYGLRLFRPNNHGKDNTSRLFLAKSAQERDEWVAELRVASRVVPLEDIFELKGLLRKGAFASVHRCIRKDTKEEFAVKVIDKTSLSTHEKFLLRGEIGALKLVSHPNVVRLEAVHEDPRSISIVMTLCRGGDLWDKVRSQPSRCFNATQAKTVMRPLCEAVLYLHTLGILHRDIKPENILLVDDGAGNLGGVTLSDFGFSHQVSPKSRLACGKQLMGTPSYMAPESILHGMYGKEVDWFSCGCVLYMMLMGRAPFAGNSPSEIFRNTCHGRLGLGRGGANLWDKLPSAARELIVGLMQLDHNLRFTGEQAMRHRFLAEPTGGDADEADGGEEAAVASGKQPREKEKLKEKPKDRHQSLQPHQHQRNASRNGGRSDGRQGKAGYSRSGNGSGSRGANGGDSGGRSEHDYGDDGGSGYGSTKASSAPTRGVSSLSNATSLATTPTSSSESA